MALSYNLIAGFITIILFIFLGYKIYQNTKLMRNSGSPSVKQKSEDMMHGFLDQTSLWAKLAKGELPSSPEEDVSMAMLVAAAVREFEAQCSEYEKGQMEEHDWEMLQESILNISSMLGVKKYWLELKPDMSDLLRSIGERK